MARFGKRKDGQSYPKGKKSGTGNKGTTSVESGIDMRQKHIRIPHQISPIQIISSFTKSKLSKINTDKEKPIFKVKNAEATPQLGRPYKSEFYVKVSEIPFPNETNGKNYEGQLYMLPKLKFIHESIVKKISTNDEDYMELSKNENLLADRLISKDYGIPIGRNRFGNNIDTVSRTLANEAEANSIMIGFFLDPAVSSAGETGWDKLRELTIGVNAKDFASRRANAGLE